MSETKKGKRADRGAGAPPDRSRARKSKAPDTTGGARVTGKVELAPIVDVLPNGWNPNRMTEFQIESSRDGFRRNGWLSSQPLLVWRTDERGKKRNLIIDGEHRWRIARDLGFELGPMVFLDGLTKKQAQELTIELDSKRGQFDDVALRDLVAQLDGGAELAFRLGFDDATFKDLMTLAPMHPPADFQDVTIDAKTDYRCPKCNYEWSGAPSVKAKANRKKRDERQAAAAAE
jgi:hypothetical protein